MAERRRGLGRGLGSLIPTAPAEDQEGQERTGQQAAEANSGPVSRETSAHKAATDGERAGNTTGQAAKTKSTSKKTPSRTSSTGSKGTGKSGAATTSTKDEPSSSPAGSGKKASDSTAVARDKSSAKAKQPVQGDSKAKTASSGKSEASSNRRGTSARADMGAALRKSSGGRRPVDFFFQPSDSAPAVGSVSESDENSSPSTSGETSTAPGDAVSRETRPAKAGETGKAPQESKDTDGGESPEDLIAVPGAYFGEIPVKDIHPNRKQPRQEFDEDEMEELVHSIREIGLLQPIVIRPSTEEGDEKYELVMGERRWRATQRAGLEKIPAIVRQTQDVDLLRDALLENLHRSQLNPLEEAAAYQQLLNEFGTTQDELASRIGRSRPQISNTIRLLRLPALVQRRVAAGILSAGHARALLSLSDPAAMERLAQRIVAEGLSVRSVEEIIQSGGAEKPTQKSRKPTAPSRHHERLDYIADAFSDKLDTSVKINLGSRKGKMTIEFASVDDLNRIISVLDPEIEGD